MTYLEDIYGRQIRLTDERYMHIETDHPEMDSQLSRMQETLANPNVIVRSRTDQDVELFYKHYRTTPVTEKYLCVVVKTIADDSFIITAYFTDTVKRGEVLWESK